MNKTGLIYSSDCLKHIPMEGKPEVPERVSATMEHFRQIDLLSKLTVLTPKPATDEDIARVHTEELMNYVRELCEKGYDDDAIINGDVYISPGTYQAAAAAAGGAIFAADSVMKGHLKNAFNLVRPPGHHASRNLPAGYCFFNNTAIAIEHLAEKYKTERVAIFDWDAHCGHGTMSVYYESPKALTISVHQDPSDFYPGTGFVDQIGEGDGKGYCMNIPVPAGTGDPDYMFILDDFVLPKIRRYKPDIIFIAAGQDSHKDDPTSCLELSDDCYAAMTTKLMDVAEEVCGGRLVVTLEGGYNVKTLPRTHQSIVLSLLGVNPPEITGEIKGSTKKVLWDLRGKLRGTDMDG